MPLNVASEFRGDSCPEAPLNRRSKNELTLGASVYNHADAPNTFYRQQFYGIGLPAPNLPNRTAVPGNELQLLGRTWSVWGR